MKIKHLSVSRSQVWTECKLKYKYKYHLELASLTKEPPYLIYGKAIHKIIELYTKNKGEKTINEVKNEVINGEISLEDNAKNDKLTSILPESYIKRFKPELEAFMKLNEKLGFNGEFEWGFEMDLDPPNKKTLYGIIDRIIKKEDQYIIIDYKTTQKGSSFRKNNVTNDLQLRCYAKVVMDHFNVDPKNIKTALYYLDGAELVGASFSKKTLDTTEQEMLKIYNEIQESDPTQVRGSLGKHCRFCDYSKICPLYNPSQAMYRKK